MLLLLGRSARRSCPGWIGACLPRVLQGKRELPGCAEWAEGLPNPGARVSAASQSAKGADFPEILERREAAGPTPRW